MAGQGSNAPGPKASAEGIATALSAAALRWPDVSFDLADASVPAEVSEYAAELLLTRACVRGDRAAQKHMLALCTEAATRVKGARNAPQVAELAADIAENLCSAPPGESPKLMHFRAAGPLHAWLHVCAVRQSLRTQSKQRAVSLETHVWDRVVSDALPPAAMMDRAALVSALRENLSVAIDALSDRQRDVLRMRLVDGHSIDAIGATFGVHRATAARWVDDVRASLRTTIFAALKQQSGMNDDDFASMCRSITESVYATLANHLKGGVET